MNAMERLNNAVIEKGPLLAGLDPDFTKILALYAQMGKFSEAQHGKKIFSKEEVVMDFCCKYIAAVKEEVAAIKINIAFFEAHGLDELFWLVAKEASDAGLYVIADVKRADIGNTSKQYAEAFLYKNSCVDAITINPYFGTDGVKPFLDMAKENEKAVFVLVKTSNPSSSEIQDLELADGRKVYQQVAELVKQWGEYTRTSENEEYSLVGAVVGATHPEEAKQLREQLPNTFFLVPGYGAQGATAEDVVVNFDSCCGGAIVNSSRGLMFACDKEPWKSENELKDWPKATESAAFDSQRELLNAIRSSQC